ncbi:MAG: hypothetical protein KBT53_10640 [Porticoccus sp.]|nr:hypothetical protein [Porticoccus sp.]MBQ0806507.1 hypothetical protein [Porticoccus sp.]MDX2350133.1 DUF6316 family protein [Porticoccus sp.]
MSLLRQEENSERNPPIRSDRYFKLHNFWFFATREGAAVGPFDSKEGAVNAVVDFIEFAKKADPETLEFFVPDIKYAV